MPRERKLEPRLFLTTLDRIEFYEDRSVVAAWSRGGVAVRIPNGRRQRRQRLITLNSAQGKKVRTAVVSNHLGMH